MNTHKIYLTIVKNLLFDTSDVNTLSRKSFCVKEILATLKEKKQLAILKLKQREAIYVELLPLGARHWRCE